MNAVVSCRDFRSSSRLWVWTITEDRGDEIYSPHSWERSVHSIIAFDSSIWFLSMEELRSAMEEHMDQMADLVQKLSSELRSGLRPAVDNFIGFFHAIDWKVKFNRNRELSSDLVCEFLYYFYVFFCLILQEPWLIGLLGFHGLLLIITIFTRKHTNFQMFLFLLARMIIAFISRYSFIFFWNVLALFMDVQCWDVWLLFILHPLYCQNSEF